MSAQSLITTKAQPLIRYWRLFWMFRRMELMRIMHNRGELLFWTVVSTMWAVLNMFGVTVYVNINGELAGWSLAEVLILLSFYAMFDTFFWDWIQPNMLEFHRLVNTGELSSLLMKPIDTQWLLMAQKNGYDSSIRFVIGFISLIYWMHVLGKPFSLLTVLPMVVTFVSAIILIYGLWFFFATLSFWVDRLENVNDIMPQLRQFWLVPTGVYRGFMSFLFTYALPIGLITTVPAETLLWRGNLTTQLILILSGLIALGVSRAFFYFSLSKFQGSGG